MVKEVVKEDHGFSFFSFEKILKINSTVVSIIFFFKVKFLTKVNPEWRMLCRGKSGILGSNHVSTHKSFRNLKQTFIICKKLIITTSRQPATRVNQKVC